MEERLIRLISAVANHPELYDASCYFYRDRNKKDLAWRHISERTSAGESGRASGTHITRRRGQRRRRGVGLQQDRGGDGSSSRSWGFWTPSSPRGRQVAIWCGSWRTSPLRTRYSPERQQGSPSQKNKLILQQSHPLLLLLAPQSLVPPLLLLHSQAHRGGQLRGGRGRVPGRSIGGGAGHPGVSEEATPVSNGAFPPQPCSCSGEHAASDARIR